MWLFVSFASSLINNREEVFYLSLSDLNFYSLSFWQEILTWLSSTNGMDKVFVYIKNRVKSSIAKLSLHMKKKLKQKYTSYKLYDIFKNNYILSIFKFVYYYFHVTLYNILYNISYNRNKYTKVLK